MVGSIVLREDGFLEHQVLVGVYEVASVASQQHVVGVRVGELDVLEDVGQLGEREVGG